MMEKHTISAASFAKNVLSGMQQNLLNSFLRKKKKIII